MAFSDLPHTTPLSKATLIGSLLALAAYVVGMAAPYWLSQDFEVTPPDSNITLDMNIHLGLFETCEEERPMVPGGHKTHDCDTHGDADWQKIGMVCALIALGAGVVAFTLSLFASLFRSMAHNAMVQFLVILTDFGAVAFMVPPIILHPVNHEREIRGEEVVLDLDWAYIVTAAAAGFWFILLMLNLLDCASERNKYIDIASIQPTQPSKP